MDNTGVPAPGHAALDFQGAEAVVTIETSDEPFGMLSIAAASLHVTTEERDRTLSVYVNREFGTSGEWAPPLGVEETWKLSVHLVVYLFYCF